MDYRRYDKNDFDFQNRPRNMQDRRRLGSDPYYDYEDRSQNRPSWQPTGNEGRSYSENQNWRTDHRRDYMRDRQLDQGRVEFDRSKSSNMENRDRDFQSFRSHEFNRSPYYQEDFGSKNKEGTFESMKESVKNFFGKGPKGYKRSDERIREDVCEALYRHPHIDASNIEVSVKDGTVTLLGTVDDRQTKRLAEDVVEDCPGVSNVSNQILVSRSVSPQNQIQSFTRDQQ